MGRGSVDKRRGEIDVEDGDEEDYMHEEACSEYIPGPHF